MTREPTPFERLFGTTPQRGVEKAVWKARRQGWNAALRAVKEVADQIADDYRANPSLAERASTVDYVSRFVAAKLEQPT